MVEPIQKKVVVQQRAIAPLVKRHDIIVQSQYGTGKTAVFSLGVL
jgi:Superfamily II DNA and RNA helicases